MAPLLPASKKLRVLVVDDDPDSRFLCRRLIERLGHGVTTADDGLDAMRKIRDSPWDVILTDQNMPGASGIDVLERAARLRPEALRILMSTILDPETKHDARDRGRAHALIEKPLHRSLFEYAGRALLTVRNPPIFEVRLAEG